MISRNGDLINSICLQLVLPYLTTASNSTKLQLIINRIKKMIHSVILQHIDFFRIETFKFKEQALSKLIQLVNQTTKLSI